MNEHGEEGWEPDARRGVADTTYGHQSDLSTIATGFTSSSARLGIICRGTRVPRRFYLRRNHLCCCSPRTKGGSEGQSNPLLGCEQRQWGGGEQ